MAVRYVEIGQYPDVRREVRGKLSEILVATANPGTYAAPEDVTGCFLEMGADGKWDGASVGSFGSFEELYALPTAYLAFGARASVNGVQYTYGAGGWVVAGGGSSAQKEAALPFKPWQMEPNGTSGTGSASYTYSQVLEMPDICYGIIPVLYNLLRSPLPILGAKFTTIDSIAGSVVTTGQTLTVNGVGVTSIPAADGTTASHPCGMLVCDPIYFTPVARTDGGLKTLGMLKIAYATTAPRIYFVPSGANDLVKYGAWGSVAGNGLATSFAASHTSEMYCLAEFIAVSAVPKITVGVVGDSIAGGTSSGGVDNGGGLVMACEDLGLPLANWAKGGQASTGRDATVAALIAAGINKHSVTFMELWTQNDGAVTIPGVDATYGKGLILFDKMLKNGMNPVIITPAPLDSAPAVVTYLYNKIITSGFPYIDIFTPLSDGTGAYKPGTSGDGIHPNAAGHALTKIAYVKYLTPVM